MKGKTFTDKRALRCIRDTFYRTYLSAPKGRSRLSLTSVLAGAISASTASQRDCARGAARSSGSQLKGSPSSPSGSSTPLAAGRTLAQPNQHLWAVS